MAYIERTEAVDQTLRRIRTVIRDGLRVATTVGFGPRFLHSTGQLHKGGPAKGRFVQITADDRTDLEVPGEAYSFGTLKRAQALGDLEALQKRGRPVIRLHLPAEPDEALSQLESAFAEAVKNAAR